MRPGLGRAVEHDRLAAALAGDGAEHAQRAAAARQQPPARLLAEHDGVREVDGQQAARAARGRPRAGPACANMPAGDDDGVEAAQRRVGRVQRRREGLGLLEIARRDLPTARASARAARTSRSRALRSRSSASRPSRNSASPRAAMRRASARPIPLVAPRNDDLHRRRARRSLELRRPEQAHRLRAAERPVGIPLAPHRAGTRRRRGSMARKCSARVKASLAR